MKRTQPQSQRKKRRAPCPDWCNYHETPQAHIHMQRCLDCKGEMVGHSWIASAEPPPLYLWCYRCISTVEAPWAYWSANTARIERLKSELKAAGDEWLLNLLAEILQAALPQPLWEEMVPELKLGEKE